MTNYYLVLHYCHSIPVINISWLSNTFQLQSLPKRDNLEHMTSHTCWSLIIINGEFNFAATVLVAKLKHAVDAAKFSGSTIKHTNAKWSKKME